MIAVLGNTPELSALELERLGLLQDWNGGQVAKVSDEAELDQLGGTVKLAETTATIPRDLSDLDQLQKYLQGHDGKVRFGFSVYAGDDSITNKVVKHYAKKLKPIGISWKKQLRDEHGISIRFVESKEPQLSSVIVRKEKLLDTQTDFIVAVYKKHIVLARTVAVQDFKRFSQQDYGRPQRDHKSGMLPPKVARMMINIANPEENDTILDPFCGSGTVLQEALLLGHESVIGSDISKKSISDSAENLQWLNLPVVPLHVADVKEIDTVIDRKSIQCIVAEGYLGPTRPKKTQKVHRQMEKLYTETLAALTKILTPGARVVLAVPAWQRYEDVLTLNLQKHLQELGYTEFHQPIFYGRAHAKVLRQILLLEYSSPLGT